MKALAQNLAVTLKDGGATGWAWFAKATTPRPPGNPFERVVTRARQRLAEVGISHYDDQTEWLRAVGFLGPSRTWRWYSWSLVIAPY